MSSQPAITFFIDRCLGNKQIVVALRQAGLTVTTHDEHFPPSALDIEWLPQVSQQGWVVLTKDAKISKNALERMTVTRTGTRMFILAAQNISGAEMADIFQKAATKMQEFTRKHRAPFIAKIYRSGKVEMWKDYLALQNELDS